MWLNVFKNAYQAVDEKGRSPGDGYVPTVTFSTTAQNDVVEVRISDYGQGIPKKHLGKVFEPFFMTKPTYFGNTALGLSLSLDIVSKGHGGSMRVEAGVEEGPVFIVSLPLQSPV